MNTDTPTRHNLHPVIWVAAVAVILASMVGIATWMGWLPRGQANEEPGHAATPSPAPAPVTQAPEAPAGVTSPPAAAPSPPRPTREATTHRAPRRPASPQPAARAHAEASAAHGEVAACTDCGTIDSVRVVMHEGKGSGLGAVAGGVLGGVLGHGVGQGSGRDIATVAGAVGGAVLGNRIEKSQRETQSYEVIVRLEDGSTRAFDSPTEPPWRIGDKVRIKDGAIEPR